MNLILMWLLMAAPKPMPSVRPTFFGSIAKVYQSTDSDFSAVTSEVR